MTQILRSASFRPWLSQAKRTVMEALQGNASKPLAIGCYCRKGVHRSVSCATYLFHALSQDPSIGPMDIRHCSASTAWIAHHCNLCEACQNMSSAKRAAISECCFLWRTALQH